MIFVDIEIDFGRTLQTLSVTEKSLAYPLAESGHAQIFEKKVMDASIKGVHRTAEYISFLYDEYQKLKEENERQKTAILILKGKASRKKKKADWDEDIRRGQVQGMW